MKRISVHELSAWIGAELGVSDWLLLDQRRVDQFAEATGDFNWIHTDEKRAGAERGGTIAHGYLILSLVPLLIEQIVEITNIAHALNYGLDRVRFVREAKVGSAIRLRARLRDVKPKAPGLLAFYDLTIEGAEGERPICAIEAVALLLPTRGDPIDSPRALDAQLKTGIDGANE